MAVNIEQEMQTYHSSTLRKAEEMFLLAVAHLHMARDYEKMLFGRNVQLELKADAVVKRMVDALEKP